MNDLTTLSDDELDAVAGGFLNFSHSFNGNNVAILDVNANNVVLGGGRLGQNNDIDIYVSQH